MDSTGATTALQQVQLAAADGSVAFWSAAFGAVVGGAISFIASITFSVMRSHQRRWAKHQHALVRLETLLNNYLSILSDIEAGVRRLLTLGQQDDGRIRVVWQMPSRLPIDHLISDDLLCLRVKNDLFGLTARVRKINHDLVALYDTVSWLQKSLLTEQLKKERFTGQVEAFKVGLSDMPKYLLLVKQDAIELCSMTRVRLKHDVELGLLRCWRMPVAKRVSEDEISTERGELLGEIAKVIANSRQRQQSMGIKSEDQRPH